MKLFMIGFEFDESSIHLFREELDEEGAGCQKLGKIMAWTTEAQANRYIKFHTDSHCFEYRVVCMEVNDDELRDFVTEYKLLGD